MDHVACDQEIIRDSKQVNMSKHLDLSSKIIISLEEFHQHMVLAYAENFFVISSYLWPTESKSEWCKCVHVERSEIWVKKCIFWAKSMFLACCEAFTHFSLSIRIDNNFLIIISGDSTTYCIDIVVCVFYVKNVNFQYFWFKYQFFTLRKVFKIIYFSFWLLLNLSLRYFWIHMHTYWLLRILGQKAVFLWFFDKNMIFFWLYRVCRDFFFCLWLNLSSWF